MPGGFFMSKQRSNNIMSFAKHTVTAPTNECIDKEITLSMGDETIQKILVPSWWSEATTITAVVTAIVHSGKTWRSVNTNDVIKFTIDWMQCHEEDCVMLLDIWVSWKEVK
jgi:hypothetical protein